MLVLECLARFLDVAHMSDWTLSAVSLKEFLVRGTVSAAVVLGGALHALVAREAAPRCGVSAWRSASWRTRPVASTLGSRLGATFTAATIWSSCACEYIGATGTSQPSGLSTFMRRAPGNFSAALLSALYFKRVERRLQKETICW